MLDLVKTQLSKIKKYILLDIKKDNEIEKHLLIMLPIKRTYFKLVLALYF
jgi:hypothetical protein